MNTETQLPTYPTLRFFLAKGHLISWLCATACLLLGLYGSWATGHGMLLFAGSGLGALVGLLLRAFVELVQIIFDTLVPR